MSSPELRAARAAASNRFKPYRVRCLLVAEAPPSASDRYFYFEDVRSQDSLFREVAGVALGAAGDRSAKQRTLAEFSDRGIFLIDLSLDPVRPRQKLDHLVDPLVERCRELAPDSIVLIKASVYDIAFAPLRAAGLPVEPVRIPFPGSGQQLRFREAFAAASRPVRTSWRRVLLQVVGVTRAKAGGRELDGRVWDAMPAGFDLTSVG